jgi:outer membrane beta-barrel protein
MLSSFRPFCGGPSARDVTVSRRVRALSTGGPDRSWLSRGIAHALCLALVAGIALGFGGTARAESPGIGAIEDFKSGHVNRKAVENRFFLKEKRFEIAPMFGYVPNNPYARRYNFGAAVGYHFNETFAAQAQVMYAPDLGENDVKGLVGVLLDRAFNSTAEAADTFQQPLDKVTLAANFGVVWAPLYGKINLVGETVLNLDFYVFAGAGMVSKVNYFATYDEVGAATGDVVTLTSAGNEVKVAPYIGVGQNYFLNRLMAFKLDFRASFWIDGTPQYNPAEEVTTSRVYNNVALCGGLSFFLPNMKPRLYDF